MSRGLGDVISEALAVIGVTDDRVSRFVGAPCGCRERREKLNALSVWARRVLAGRTERAREYLEQITGGEE